MMQRIDFNELSKTFQDTIIVTRQLGFQYIWIDSLCIVQNDLQDWERESALMFQIYTGGSCNICAMSAKDGSEGLFFSRNPAALTFKIDLQMEGTSLDDSPLNKRAWLCQERIMSPCNVHFTSKQVFWECRESVGSELAPEPAGKFLKPFYSVAFSSVKLASSLAIFPAVEERSAPQPGARMNAYEAWTKVLTMYNCARLTFAKDRLVAIGGLAALFEKVLDDEYLAGLRRRELPNILDVKIEYLNIENRFGQVRGGKIVLNGKLALVVCNPRPGFSDGLVLKTGPNYRNVSGPWDYRANWDMPSGMETDFGFLGAERAPEAVILLPILYLSAAPHLNELQVFGLILVPAGSGVGYFHRVGLFRINRQKAVTRFWKACKYFNRIPPNLG
ncbi:hypothetical protein G7Y89_g13520 [Cudoniella acicularis]|uniref:Heterokaryon incompatibility domain-containing protein n=1 Tax=Cudoniella acicularis TaxID=354080 RepID=A0A8H4R840_9HELO|nr:hypothetical protein G7Y89_g13520 [Cudoniella acicularis]